MAKQQFPQSKSSSSHSTGTGVIPPHGTDLERALLGALLLERNLYHEIAAIVRGNVFYNQKHEIIFDAIRQQVDAGEPVDLYTIGTRLQKNGTLAHIGGPAYLAELSQVVGSASHSVYHAQQLYQLSVLRGMISELSSIVTKCYDGDLDSATTEYTAAISRIDSLFAGSGAEKHIRSILKRHAEVVEQRVAKANCGQMQGVTFGLSQLDRITGGAQPGQLIILAARPSMGKTAVALSIAKAAAMDQKSTLVCSLEMDDISLADRLICSYAGVESSRLKTGRMDSRDWHAYEAATAELSKLNISIDDTGGASLSRISSTARNMRRKGQLDLLIIDYLQLVGNDSAAMAYRGNREQEVALISKGLKTLAKELSIPVLLLCQLNRAAETRANKMPQLSDLRESGAIEQDADIVMMPFRPAYYPNLEFTLDNGEPIPQDVGLLIICKHRDGMNNVNIPFRYSYNMARIEDYNPDIPSDINPQNPNSLQF